MNNPRIYNLFLPYFKQGDDLAYQIDKFPNHAEALAAHADNLTAAADILRKVRDYAALGMLRIAHADTHHISVECEEELGTRLVEEGILYNDSFYEEQEDVRDEADEDAPEDEDVLA